MGHGSRFAGLVGSHSVIDACSIIHWLPMCIINAPCIQGLFAVVRMLARTSTCYVPLLGILNSEFQIRLEDEDNLWT